jgi:putative oxidoreductase
MKKALSTIFNPGSYTNNISLALLWLRLITGIFMLTHGDGKLLMLLGDDPIKFSDPVGIGVEASLILVVFAEVFCSVFLIFGVATRLSAIPLIITMLVAALIVHSSDPFGRKELPLLFASIFIVFAFLGAGKYSVDNLIYKKLRD